MLGTETDGLAVNLLSLSSPTVRHLAVVTTGKFVGALAGIVAIRIFTELAPPSVFGEVSLVLGYLTFGMQVFVAPVTEAQVRLYPNHMRAGTGPTFTGIVFRLALKAASVLTIIIFAILALGLAESFSGDMPVLAVLLGGYVFATTVKSVGINRLNAERRLGRFAAWNAMEPILLVLLGALFLWNAPQPIALLTAHFGAIALAAIFFLATGPHSLKDYFPRGPNVAPDTANILREIRAFGWPFIIFGILGWILSLFDRYALAALLDLTAVGKYVAVFAIASQLVIVPSSALSAVFRPSLYEAASSGDHNAWRHTARIWSALLTAGSATLLTAIWFGADLFLPLVLAPDYRDGARALMLVVAFAYVLRMYAQLLEILLMSFHVPSLLILPKILGAATNVVCSLALIPIFGTMGAATAGVATSVIMLAVTILQLHLVNRRSRYDFRPH